MSAVSSPMVAVLREQRVLFIGKLAGMSRREACQLVRDRGGQPVEKLDETTDLAVAGEESLPWLGASETSELLSAATRREAETGRPHVLSETEFWQRLGLVEEQQNVRRLYTPAMLADLLGVPLAIVRRWHRRGLIVPAREVRKLPYFDFQEVNAARRLAELLASGMTPRAIERQLADLRRVLPGVARPLAQLSIIVQGRELLLRQGDGLLEPGGQRRFDFDSVDAAPADAADPPPRILSLELARPDRAAAAPGPAELLHWGAELEDAGELTQAIEMYRAALAAGGARADICFRLAELLYGTGDLPAARERYYATIELDEDCVEARANLGCVLAELGEPDLAAAAFEGALAFHAEYPDAHYHLARLLDDLCRPAEAQPHWEAFLSLSSDSPWAEEARQRLLVST